MSFLWMRRLVFATVCVSAYNLVVYFLDWFKASEADYADLTFWASTIQLVLTVVMVQLWPKNQKLPELKKWFMNSLGLWLVIILLLATNMYFLDMTYMGQEWEIAFVLLTALGLPIYAFASLDDVVGSSAPFWGLFHTPWQQEDDQVIYISNFGVGLSWLLFNILFLILIVNVYRESKSLKEDTRGDDPAYSPEASTPPNCASCSSALKQGQRFCSNCGSSVQDRSMIVQDLKVECDQCGARLEAEQKFCGSCGLEIKRLAEVGSSFQVNHQVPAGSNSTWLERHVRALGGIGKTLAVAWLILNAIALISLFGGQSSPDDLSRCNGLYDANILKTYGVFRCPAIYNATGGTFDSSGLVALIVLDLIVFGCFYAYTSSKLNKSK